MRALLDVNVLICLLDAGHVHHRACTAWLARHLDSGWASCPLTQNGCVRILSQPSYPNAIPAAEAAARLHEATQDASHEFWPDSISVLDGKRLEWSRLLSGRHLTDAYLIALATLRKGRFVTLERNAPLTAVKGASERDLVCIA